MRSLSPKIWMALAVAGSVCACSGAGISQIMPGTAVTVNGIPYTVQNTARGATVRNFQTGRTAPEVLLVNAGLAAEQVTGCSVTSISKDADANTYNAALSCAS